MKALASLAEQAARPAKIIEDEPLTVEEFAEAIRRKPRYVSDRCRTGQIRTLPGKPYRIPRSEALR